VLGAGPPANATDLEPEKNEKKAGEAEKAGVGDNTLVDPVFALAAAALRWSVPEAAAVAAPCRELLGRHLADVKVWL
jgi:hypothetical protein